MTACHAHQLVQVGPYLTLKRERETRQERGCRNSHQASAAGGSPDKEGGSLTRINFIFAYVPNCRGQDLSWSRRINLDIGDGDVYRWVHYWVCCLSCCSSRRGRHLQWSVSANDHDVSLISVLQQHISFIYLFIYSFHPPCRINNGKGFW